MDIGRPRRETTVHPSKTEEALMHQVLRRLLDLQEVDQQILRLKKEIEQKPAELKREQGGLKEAETDLERQRGLIKDGQKLLDGKNLELKTAEEFIKKLEIQAQTLKTNAEYAAMQKQIETKKAEISGIEDRILEAMELCEGARKALPPKEALVKQRQKEIQVRSDRVTAEVEAAKVKLVALEAEWQVKAKGIEPDRLPQYKLLRDRHRGTAVAEVSLEGICQGCFLSQTTHRLNMAMTGEIVPCGSCERFLWVRH